MCGRILSAGGEKMGAQGRKRKLFTGVAPIGGRSVRSLREARRITSQFHELNNQIGKINPKLLESDEQQELKKRIEEEIVSLGGRNRYQQASVVTTTHHKVSLPSPTTIAHIAPGSLCPDQQMGHWNFKKIRNIF
jgi:hypothetical protein